MAMFAVFLVAAATASNTQLHQQDSQPPAAGRTVVMAACCDPPEEPDDELYPRHLQIGLAAYAVATAMTLASSGAGFALVVAAVVVGAWATRQGQASVQQDWAWRSAGLACCGVGTGCLGVCPAVGMVLNYLFVLVTLPASPDSRWRVAGGKLGMLDGCRCGCNVCVLSLQHTNCSH